MRPVLLAAALAACSPPSGAGTTSGASTSTSTSSTGDAPTSTGTTDACDGSADCETDAICVADYSPSPDPDDPGTRGPAACTDLGACIGPLDLGRWCFDHQGCCESLRCRTADGVCEPPELGQTGGETTGTTSTSTTGGETTGETTGVASETDTTGPDTTSASG
ncbi:MAG: hypothetical protein JNL82_06360 [Myxococcales bacterium]|nr:hypothetical protein [Myxococcales bacterium]